MRPILRAALVAWALLSALPALAQGVANVQIGTPRLGYLDELDAGWVPVSVPLENVGTEAKVQLRAVVRGQGSDLWTSERALVLAAHARRVETVYVRASEAAQSISLEVLVDGRRMHESSRPVSFRATEARHSRPVPLHALLVRDGPHDRTSLRWLEALPRQPGATPLVVLTSDHIEPRELPDRPQGYDGIDVVALSRVAARDLDEPRRRSLFAWLRSGGRVLLLPSGDPTWFQDELVKDLLPPDAKIDIVAIPELTTLVKSLGTPLAGDASARLFTVHSSRHGVRVGGETAGGRRVPYFTVYKHGAGDVIVAACDLDSPPFTAWPNARDEVARMLHAAIEPVPDQHDSADEQRLAPWFEQALAEGELPSPLILIPVVALYVLCMGPLNQRFVRRASTPVLSVVTIPAIALIFTVLCFVAGYIVRGSSTSIDRLTVIETHPGEDLAREWAGLRIRSAGSTKYTVSTDPLLVVTRRSWQNDEERGTPIRVSQDEGRFEIRDVPLSLWERAFFQARGALPLGGAFEVAATPSRVMLRNKTNLDLGPGVVFLPGTDGFRVPPLAPGATFELDGSKASSVKPLRPEILAVIAPESDGKVGDRALDSFLEQLRMETTYVAIAKNAPASFNVAGRAGPDRDLCVFIVQGDDQARDLEVYRYALSVARERWHEDYEDVIGMLAAITPASRVHREAQTLRAILASAKFIEKAEDAFEAGDLELARNTILSILDSPALASDDVREIRARLDAWKAVAATFATASDATSSNLRSAAELYQNVVGEQLRPENVWGREAKRRAEAIALAERSWSQAITLAKTALSEGRAYDALVAIEAARWVGNDTQEAVPELVASADDEHHFLECAKKLARGTSLERIQAKEILRLLVKYRPLDERRDEARKLLQEIEAGEKR